MHVLMLLLYCTFIGKTLVDLGEGSAGLLKEGICKINRTQKNIILNFYAWLNVVLVRANLLVL